MAGIMKSSIVVFMVMMMVATTTMAQTRHVVGGSLGWTIPPAGAYTTWASQQNFTVGDSLYFNYTTGMHNVAEVAQAAYGPCTTSNPISLTTTGPTTITLSAAGDHYYICTVGTHCQIGQKLNITVVASATAPTTPPPAATPAPATTPTASPPTATPSPSPMSPPTTPSPSPMSPPTTTPTPSPIPSAAPTPATTPAPSPVGDISPSPPTPDTTPTGSTPPAPGSDTAPPPPSPSASARSFTAVVPTTFLAVALALFY